jgi:FkbM family methyltransferase
MELRRKHDVRPFLAALNLGTIIDGGANDGGFASFGREIGPSATIHSFEPVPWLYRILTDKFKADVGFHAYDQALGDTNSEAEFEINDDQYSSSLLPMRLNAESIFPGLNPSNLIRVRVITLDSWSAGREVRRPLLLKLDLEGNELAALRGATVLLKRVDYILTEISFIVLRDGQPSLREIDTFLGQHGFEVLDVYIGHQNVRTGRTIWADVLFGRSQVEDVSDSSMRNSKRCRKQKRRLN